MVTIVKQAVISAPLERVQSAFDDFSNIYKFHPAVRQSEAVRSGVRGVGAERMCHTYDGQSFHERLVERRDGRWVVRVLAGMPARHAQAEITAKAASEEQTEVRLMMEVYFNFPMSLMAPLVKQRFGKILGQLLVGLEDHLQTGREVGEHGKLGAPIAPAGTAPVAA